MGQFNTLCRGVGECLKYMSIFDRFGRKVITKSGTSRSPTHVLKKTKTKTNKTTKNNQPTYLWFQLFNL